MIPLLKRHSNIFSGRWDHGIVFWMCDLWAQNLIPFQNKPTHRLNAHFPKEMDFSFCFLSSFLGKFNQRGWKHVLFWLFSLLSHIISSFKNFAMLQKLKCVCVFKEEWLVCIVHYFYIWILIRVFDFLKNSIWLDLGLHQL